MTRVRRRFSFRGEPGPLRRPCCNYSMESSEQGHVLEVRVGEVNELFNAIDPAPFRERDLDPKAEEFIVTWAQELRSEGPMTVILRLDQQKGAAMDPAVVSEAVRGFFKQRALATRRRLRMLLRRGRTSLLIGLACLTASIFLGDMVASALAASRFSPIVRESFIIGGWVAMWRPLEVFLYVWWPIRAEARLFDRLSTMTVTIMGADG